MTSNNRSPESGSDPMESVRYRNSIDSAVNLLTSLGAQRDALGNWSLAKDVIPDYFRLSQVASVFGVMFQPGVKVSSLLAAAYRHASRERDEISGKARFDALVAAVTNSVPDGCSIVPKDSITDRMLDSAMSTSLHETDLESIRHGASVCMGRDVSTDEAAFIARFLAALRAAPSYGSADYMSALHSMFTVED